MRASLLVLTLAVSLGFVVPAAAQAPAEPKIWTTTLSAGLALTSGNTDTYSINAAYDIVYNPQTRNVVKSDALFIRSETEGALSAHRTGINIRDEYSLTPRTYVFGQHQYLRDEFKNIDYLLAPTAGIGYKIFDTERTKFAVDSSVGAVWEKNPDVDVAASGAIAIGEKLSQTLTATTTLAQTFSGLWKMTDVEDALYTAGISLAASMSTRTQLKVEFLDTFKNKPPLPTVQKNDIALVMSIVYKI